MRKPKPNMAMNLSWTQRAWETESGARHPLGERASITVGPRDHPGSVTLAHLEALIQEAVKQGAPMDTTVDSSGVTLKSIGVEFDKPAPEPEPEPEPIVGPEAAPGIKEESE